VVDPDSSEETVAMVRSHRTRADRVESSLKLAVRSIACAMIWVGGCAPVADHGGCSEDADCDDERGQVCDVEASECIDKVVDTTTTGTATPTLTGVTVPFHRGTVCYAESVQAGARIPVSLTPCLHPCLTVSKHFHSNYYSCIGASCDAWAFVYFTADGANCPADAFGAFDRTMCDVTQTVALGVNSTIGDNEPVQGTMTLEVPYLTNEDVQVIDAAGRDIDLMNMKIAQYPSQANRVAGDIDLNAANPAPPEMCDGATNCVCKDIGF
jgi:hypothetical protein